MRVGIDISQIIYPGTGVSRFTEGLVDAVVKWGKNVNWTFFFSSLRRNLNPSITDKIISDTRDLRKFRLPPTLLSFLWNDLHVVDIESFVGKVDWFMTSDWLEPPTACKKCSVVHDLVFLRYPGAVTDTIRHVQSMRLKWIKKESEVIFCDSESTKNDLIDLLKFPPDKLVVNYPGVDISASALPINYLKKKFSLANPYILSVGKLEPRKNINNLISAFLELNLTQLDLVIVGPKGWDNSNYPVNKNVRFLGYVSEIELAALFKQSLFFIFPSLWEGFGYPLVEAMKLGVPTAASNTSSLKEIGSEATLLFDPQNKESIKNAIRRMVFEESFRMSLSEKAKDYANSFTWRAYYQTFINTLNERS